MPTSYTTLLGLALPVTGELSGTWGDVVSNYITQYLDSAVAGTQTISGSQTAVTLSVTNGSSLVTAGSGATGSAQFQIINCTGNPAGLLTITAPASSRQYIIINATSTSQSVKIVGTGPTTGVTLIAGEKAHVAWNGSDFVKIATTAAAGGSNTQVQYNSSGVLAGSSNMTFDGTNLTVGGTASATKLIPTGGSATGNGMYLPAANSVAITTNGAQAIYIDSSQNVGIGTSSPSYKLDVSGEIRATSHVRGTGSDQIYLIGGASNNNNNIYIGGSSAGTANTIAFTTNATERMRLDSSGNLGIGTTSPGAKVHVYDTSNSKVLSQTTTGYAQFQASSTSGDFHIAIDNSTGAGFGAGAYSRLLYSTGAYPMVFTTNATERMRLDSSGNLGLGVTPSAWASGQGAMQFKFGGLSAWALGGVNGYIYSNAYYDGTNNRYVNNGTAASYAINNGTGIHAWFIAPSGTAGNAISFTQAMTLDASGNLGLGTTSITNCRFQIKGANNTTNAYADGLKVTSNNETVEVQYSWAGINANDTLRIATGGSERARITSGGDLYVGQTTGGLQAARSFSWQGAGDGSFYISHSTANASGDPYIRFGYNATQIGTITQNGTTAVAYNTSSDYRLKENIQPMTGALAKVAALKPCTYKWKADGSDGEGFIAHELAEVAPQCVTGEKDAVDAEGKPVYQGIDTSFLVATLTAAIQEQQTIIQSLTARIAALESKGA